MEAKLDEIVRTRDPLEFETLSREALMPFLQHLTGGLDVKTLRKMKETDEEDFITSVHHNWGRQIRNDGLWEQSGPLHKFFFVIGIKHPDDMSAMLFTCFHRFLNEKPFKILEQVQFYAEYWQKQGSTNMGME